jgi:hypothetical protein
VSWATSLKELVVEPLPADLVAARAHPASMKPVVAVMGLRSRCGATTVARALGVELALRDPDGAALVSATSIADGGVPLGTVAARRLTRAAGRALPLRARSVGRLCLAEADSDDRLVEATRGLAPVVLDVADPSRMAIAGALADLVVVVAVPDCEPALAPVVADSLTSMGPEPLVVLNRDVEGDGRWAGHGAPVRVPESQLGARLARAGREAPGAYRRAIVSLVDLLSEAI